MEIARPFQSAPIHSIATLDRIDRDLRQDRIKTDSMTHLTGFRLRMLWLTRFGRVTHSNSAVSIHSTLSTQCRPNSAACNVKYRLE